MPVRDWFASLGLQCRQGAAAPHWQASERALKSAEGLSRWFSHTQPVSSQNSQRGFASCALRLSADQRANQGNGHQYQHDVPYDAEHSYPSGAPTKPTSNNPVCDVSSQYSNEQ
jgi:hypothetical protein